MEVNSISYIYKIPIKVDETMEKIEAQKHQLVSGTFMDVKEEKWGERLTVLLKSGHKNTANLKLKHISLSTK